jgi:hypothetical protein
MMRKLGWTLIVTLLAGGPAVGQEWAKKMFKTTEHDFGTVARGAKAEFDFDLSNIFLEDVHVLSARSSCGCTSVRVVKPDLKTYQEGAIHATFNTGLFQGQRGATLTVVLDKPFYAEVQLHVKGFIRNDVMFTPGSVQLGEVDQGAAREQKVTVSYAGRSDWKIVDVKTSSPYLSAGFTQIGRQGGQAWYELAVRLSPKAPVGYVNDHLTLVTNDGQGIQMPLLVEGRVIPGVTVSPATLFMGVIEPGKEVTKPLVVQGKKPFRILSITCGDQSFKFGKENDSSPKTLHVIPVTFHAGSNSGKVTKTIRIETDLGATTPELSAYAVVGKP